MKIAKGGPNECYICQSCGGLGVINVGSSLEHHRGATTGNHLFTAPSRHYSVAGAPLEDYHTGIRRRRDCYNTESRFCPGTQPRVRCVSAANGGSSLSIASFRRRQSVPRRPSPPRSFLQAENMSSPSLHNRCVSLTSGPRVPLLELNKLSKDKRKETVRGDSAACNSISAINHTIQRAVEIQMFPRRPRCKS